MDADDVMKLFDSCWFELGILKKHPKFSSLLGSEENPDGEVEEKPQIVKIPSLHVRSMSESEQLSSFKSEQLSPDSVLPGLRAILSGIEVAGAQNGDVASKNKRESKSLSDLEFEEVKGFMDLGFVFSEEDKESRLGSIIPGLQRLGKKESEGTEVSRPYLSEAWSVSESPLMNWRVPSLRNETAVKDNLKWWAHAVASTVR